MKRSFFITLGLYLLLVGAIWKLYEPLPIPKKKSIHIADIRILKPKRCECGCQMQKSPPKKMQQPKIEPKPKPKPKRKVKPRAKPKSKPKVKKARKVKPKSKPKKRSKQKKAAKKRVPKKVASKPQKKFTPAPKPSQSISVAKPQKVVSRPTPSSKVSSEPKISYRRFYIQTFLDRIEEAIRRHTHYPRIARRTHKEGVVEICFTLEPGGKVIHLHIMKSSGHKILDRAAKKTILQAAKEFPHPKKAVDLQIPIEYRLR